MIDTDLEIVFVSTKHEQIYLIDVKVLNIIMNIIKSSNICQ